MKAVVPFDMRGRLRSSFAAAIALASLIPDRDPTKALAATINDFHSPQSQAEASLDRILKRSDQDGAQLDNLFNRYGPVPLAQRFDYRTILTTPLLKAMRAEERRAVQADCGGKYTEGYVCGLDYSPITCAQDRYENYLYRTTRSSPDEATIEYRWPDEKSIVATYRLKVSAGVWKIDGVNCHEGGQFNFPKK